VTQAQTPQTPPAAPPDITPEMIEKMTPQQQREVAHTLKETAVFLSQVTQEDIAKVQAIPWEKLQQKPDFTQPLTEEDKKAYRDLWQLVQEGKTTMAQVLGYSEAELYRIYTTGSGLSDQGRLDDAMKVADGLLFLIPNFVPALMLRAEILRKQKKLEESIQVYDQAVAADPTFIQAYFERAKASFALEHWQAFIMDMESVVTLDPEAKTQYGKWAREMAKMAEEELLKAGMTQADIAQVEAEILAQMQDVPLDQIPEIDDEGNQIKRS
jgi:tetratricopeptide (TPR) repeat protein